MTDCPRPRRKGSAAWVLLLCPLAAPWKSNGENLADARFEAGILRPFVFQNAIPGHEAIHVATHSQAYFGLKHGPDLVRLLLPLGVEEQVLLELRRFDVMAPSAVFVSAGDGDRSLVRPEVVLFRGRVFGEAQSHAFLAWTGEGAIYGSVLRQDGNRYRVTRVPDRTGRFDAGPLTILRDDSRGTLPEFEEPCGLTEKRVSSSPRYDKVRSAPLLGGPRVARVAIDADHYYVDLFPSEAAAQAYIVALLGAVSDIYIRDFDIKLILEFSRMWPAGGEPFDAQNLSSFESHWMKNEDPSPYNLIHLLSGRRDTFFGGIAELADPCNGQAYAISSFLNGGFPSPVEGPDLGNWDVTVMAHEMGHNLGTLHTHDGYDPPIDQCGSLGLWARSDIMSYCHTTPGGMLNIDPRFHARVQAVVAGVVDAAGCLWRDCNDNNINDLEDLAALTSSDANANGIPDECEDCNQNGSLDSTEINEGTPDVNLNGIPDGCEPDCNMNALPDEYEVTDLLVADTNGNLVPDSCEPDCDANSVADHADISMGSYVDLDRNSVPDICQDCNGNGLEDYVDVDREANIFLAERAGFVREYHAASGVAIRNLATTALQDAYDVAFGPDGGLYVADFGGNRVVRIDVDADTATEFVPSGTGGLAGPSSLAFGANGRLYVAGLTSSNILEFDGPSGAFLRLFVPAGTGGLSSPYGLTFGPNGNLFVSSSDDTVKEFERLSGDFVGTFVAVGAGGLDEPRGLLFTPDGRLLVSSFLTNSVLEFDTAGQFTRVFSDPFLVSRAWGIRLGPNGNVFVVRHTGAIRVLEFDLDSGRYVRSFIRGDSGLVSPTGLAFRPGSANDCNQDFIPDECEPADLRFATVRAASSSRGGWSADCQPNGTPDQCDVASGFSIDCQPNGIPDECDIAQGMSLDVNQDGTPDECHCSTIPYGDVDQSGIVDVDDLLCVLNAFAVATSCPAADLAPCQGDGQIDVDDLLSMLDAFMGQSSCPDPCT